MEKTPPPKKHPDLLRRLAHNFRLERITRGMTLQEVADVVGVSRAFICQIERGDSKANLGHLEKMAVALGMDPRSLLRPIGQEGDPV